ncbi:general transcription factor 3C polypeptide 1-like, partial [Lingula anatina]|uniref:General transcription factor 3C polypeptide 1-like n=1 Tax=Lingula anatina TaxID=7574 RepID=A0A2R2MKS5_LINAN
MLWGNKLVIVASQEIRIAALFGAEHDPNWEFVNAQYCLLERIGRSRWNGAATIGTQNLLQVFRGASGHLYYVRKSLLRHGFIMRQGYLEKCPGGRINNGRLFHLKRFYQLHKPRSQVILESAAAYLEAKPGNWEVTSVLIEKLNLDEAGTRTFWKFCSNYIKSKLVPYRDVYPEATEEEYMAKNKMVEKSVRIYTLVKPLKVEEEEEDDVEEPEVEASATQLSPLAEEVLERSMLHIAYRLILSKGLEGISVKQVSSELGIPQIEARALLKALVKKELIFGYFVEVQKTKKNMFVSNVYKEQYHEQKKLKTAVKYEPPDEDGSKDNAEESPHPSENVPREELDSTMDMTMNTTADGSTVTASTSVGDEKSFVDIKHTDANPEGKRKQSRTDFTERVLKRRQYILNYVQAEKVVVFINVIKYIKSEERKAGIATEVDRRTVKRLLDQLAKESKIKQLKTVIKHLGREKEYHLIMTPELTADDPLVRSVINKAKMVHLAVGKDSAKASIRAQTVQSKLKDLENKSGEKGKEADVKQSIKKLKVLAGKLKPGDLQYDAKATRSYGLQPKFKKAEIVHKLLWYLIYEYKGKIPDKEANAPGNTSPVPSTSTEDLEENTVSKGENIDEVEPEISEVLVADDEGISPGNEAVVYLDELSWRRYLPPLPKHLGYGKGWFLVSDVLFSMPVCMFCHIISLPYRINGLLEILQDPVKKFYLVRHLPTQIVKELLYGRRFLFCFHEVLETLAVMGLLSFAENKKMKEKDWQFTYMYKKVGLLDTRESAPGYSMIETGRDYPVREYEFKNSEDIEQYWVDLLLICGDTPLGKVYQKFPEEVTRPRIYDMFRGLIKSATFAVPGNEPEEGKPMGNVNGAAGFDASLMAHLRKNWQWKAGAEKLYTHLDQDKFLLQHWKKSSDQKLKKGRLRRLTQRTELAEASSGGMTRQKFLVLSPTGQSSTHNTAPQDLAPGSKVYTVPIEVKSTKDIKLTKGGKGMKRKGLAKKGEGPEAKKKREEIESRRVKIKRRRKEKKIDEADVLAAQRMNRLRVLWTAQEDSMLLLMKVTSLFMNPHLPKFILPWRVVRDILHELSPTSHDKTSKACARRVLYMMKNPQTKNNVSIVLGETLQDQDLVTEFKTKKYLPKDMEANEKVFRKLFYKLKEKFESMFGPEEYELPATLEQLQARHTVCSVGKLPGKSVHRDATCVRDIQASVLHNIVQSSCGTVDKMGRQYMMFRVYSQYPEDLLTEVFNTMRNDHIISKKKRKSTHEMLSFLATKTFHLSQRYSQKFQVFSYRATIFPEASHYLSLLNREVGHDFTAENTGGGCAAFITMLALDKITYDIIVPDRVIDIERKRSAGEESPNESDQGTSGQKSEGQGQSEGQGHSEGEMQESPSDGPQGAKSSVDCTKSISSQQKSSRTVLGQAKKNLGQGDEVCGSVTVEQSRKDDNMPQTSGEKAVVEEVALMEEVLKPDEQENSIGNEDRDVAVETMKSLSSGLSSDVPMETDIGDMESQLRRTLELAKAVRFQGPVVDDDEEDDNLAMMDDDDDDDDDDDPEYVPEGSWQHKKTEKGKSSAKLPAKGQMKKSGTGGEKKIVKKRKEKLTPKAKAQRRWEFKMKERESKPSHKKNTVMINMEQLFFHSHIRPLKPTDTIVLRSCAIVTKLKSSHFASSPSLSINSEEILSKEVIKSIRKSQTKLIPQKVDFENFLEKLAENPDLSKQDVENAASIYRAVENWKELGITWVELQRLVGHVSRFSHLLSLLMENFL